MEKVTTYNTLFERPGKGNTEAVLKIVDAYVRRKNITKVVISSTTGYTAFLAEKIIKSVSTFIICKQDISDEYSMQKEIYNELQKKHQIVDIPKRYLQQKIGSLGVSRLRKISQGVKVAVELVEYLLEVDKVLAGERIVVVAGTLKGADTAISMIIEERKQFRIEKALCLPNASVVKQ